MPRWSSAPAPPVLKQIYQTGRTKGAVQPGQNPLGKNRVGQLLEFQPQQAVSANNLCTPVYPA